MLWTLARQGCPTELNEIRFGGLQLSTTVQHYYNRDHDFFHVYHPRTRTVEGYEEGLEDWVMDVPSRGTYSERLGGERWQALRARHPAPTVPANYGF